MYENHTLLSTSQQKVMELFLDLDRHYFSEITKKTKLTRPRTLRALRKLTKSNILKTRGEANVKYYSLNRDPLTYSALSMVEYSRTKDFLQKHNTLRLALEMFLSQYNDYLTLILFGSTVKGYAKKTSDIDLLIIKENFSKQEIKKIEDIIDMINGRTGLNLSPYLMKADEFRKKNDFVKEVQDSHILLDGAEFYFRQVL